MGTPASSDLRARSNNAFDFGRSSTNFFCSRCIRDCRRARSMVFMGVIRGRISDRVGAGDSPARFYATDSISLASHHNHR